MKRRIKMFLIFTYITGYSAIKNKKKKHTASFRPQTLLSILYKYGRIVSVSGCKEPASPGHLHRFPKELSIRNAGLEFIFTDVPE